MSKWGSPVCFPLPFPGSQAHTRPTANSSGIYSTEVPKPVQSFECHKGALERKQTCHLPCREGPPSLLPVLHRLTQSKFLLVTGTLDVIGKQMNHDLFLQVSAEWDLAENMESNSFSIAEDEMEVHQGDRLKDAGLAPHPLPRRETAPGWFPLAEFLLPLLLTWLVLRTLE